MTNVQNDQFHSSPYKTKNSRARAPSILGKKASVVALGKNAQPMLSLPLENRKN